MLSKIRSNAAMRRLRQALPPAVRAVLETLRARGGHPVLVGGAVRDAVLGVPAKDWDVAVDLPAAAVVRAFARVSRAGERHGTVMVLLHGEAVEVSSMRGVAGSNAPEAMVLADLAHRDLTINAMAVDVHTGTWWDPFAGQADLQRGRLRFVANAAERLQEDPLRGLRALRFMATLRLRPDAATLAAIQQFAPNLQNTAWERRRDEILRLLAGPGRGNALKALQTTGLLRYLAPELAGTPAGTWRQVQRATWPRNASGDASLYVFALWAWLEGLNGSQAQDILQRWCVGKHATAVAHWIDGARKPPSSDAASVRRWMVATGVRQAHGAAWLLRQRWPRRFGALPAAVQRCLARSCLSVAQLRVNGHDLQAVGIAPRAVGPVLQGLLAAVVDAPSRNRPGVLLALAHTLSTGSPAPGLGVRTSGRAPRRPPGESR